MEQDRLHALPWSSVTLTDGKLRGRANLQQSGTLSWCEWEPGYWTVGQAHNILLMPLHRIRDERYTVYSPVMHDAPSDQEGHTAR